MPIPNLTDELPINQYTASNGQTEFAFTFYIFALSDIKVYANDILKTITTDYVVRKNDGTVIGDADLPMDGGKIIFNVGRTAGEKISLNRDIPVDRSTQFSTGGAFKADSLNSELTRILTIAQQLKRDVARSFRLAPSDAEGGSLQLPTNRANNILAFDANANLILTKFADIDKASVSPFIATLLDDVSASIARGTLNAQELNANLTALAGLAGVANLTTLAGLTGASNKLPYFTGAGAMAVRDLLATTTTQGIAFLSNPITIAFNGTTQMDIGAGIVNYDNGSGQLLCTAITKTLQSSGAWTAGSGQNGLDTGARANSTWYNIFVIVKNADNTSDILYSTSRTAPTVPTGYTLVAWIGRIRTDASGNIDQNYFAKRTNYGQEVFYKTGSSSSGTTTIPWDDTIPQNTEGTEFLSLSIIPINANSRLAIDVQAIISTEYVSGVIAFGALFQDSIVNAISACWSYVSSGPIGNPLKINYFMQSGTTSETTFKFRAGPESSTTITLNGRSGSRRLGGVANSYISIKEYL